MTGAEITPLILAGMCVWSFITGVVVASAIGAARRSRVRHRRRRRLRKLAKLNPADFAKPAAKVQRP